MNIKQVNKLLSGLSNHELAAMSFDAAARLDGKETDAILNAVEKKTYVTPAKEYIIRMHDLQQVILYWSTEYWRAMYQTNLVVLFWRNDEDENTGTWMELFKRADAKLFALIRALDEICKTSGVNKSSVLTFAEIDNLYTPIHEHSPDDAKELVDHFVGILD